jgi:hypothetical protein
MAGSSSTRCAACPPRLPQRERTKRR